ncbi:MAG: ATP-binding protein [Methylococcales symbiont of Hymedesmia sp. n. MRB-2018]|nr:MAG: ATP-binding protein [Methylococcales symbiont of Hymedesmia sp. n. MRB-2018]
MIKPNWEIFKAKFCENPQSDFEWFCYLLFCKEFGRSFGIFRFKNQSAIETNPIDKDNEVIGWQAKFYGTSLSNHKDDLVKTIKKAKRDYPKITKILFYTNQEWGQNKGKKPQGLIEVEEKAKELNIILGWRTASFFESEFVSTKNEVFAKHFFTSEKSIFVLMEEQQKHTENILSQMQTSISFNNQNFEINRNKQLEELKDAPQQISILSGIGGVGKTVLIKKLYEQLKDEAPFVVFKATEFELKNINDLYADFSFYDFTEVHKDEKNKIVVIDSSEKLLGLNNYDPFKEFLSILINDEWKIIFTTRDNYLEDLNYQFFEIYNIAPLNISINNLELKELSKISEEHSFLLPKDEKLLELIRNPFYLNEYLKFYKDKEELEYSGFKNKLWNKNIKKSKPERERCFLQIAFERANIGQFFISPSCDSNILDNELVGDGILGYEVAGYFITHDIYEEWALEKIIESEFLKKMVNQDFFKKIGQSLPIRRSFRNWLSEKLLLENDDIKNFIEEMVESTEIEPFWKDEILVSVLLSNYSKVFFDLFKDELLSDEQNLLRKLTFILRIACKEVDDDFFRQLGIKNLNLFSLKYILTKPKGQGWENLIKFAYDNIESIGIKNINFILPIIHDWNSKIKEGETTRLSSLIALQYYQWIIGEDVYVYRDDTKEHLLQTILYGSSEIKDELKEIFDEILNNKWKNHRDPYYELSKIILTKMEGISIFKVLPEYVLKLADLFWSYTRKDDHSFFHTRIEIEQHFGLESNHSDYHPASAYQTPIYWLLKFHLKGTIDFILNFTNKSVQKYASSDFDNFVQNIDIFLDDENKKSQYVSHCLWNLYRGTGSPVSPYLLQSIHMALEKYFLEIGKIFEPKIIEDWLIYLLKNSESASISSVVTSIVLAYPEKTFNVAKILFKTKEFILNDTSRLVSEHGAESLYSIGKSWGIRTNEFYDEERIKTCEDKHRKLSLEHLFLNYQLFRSEGVDEKEAEKRQAILWEILDDYYRELPIEAEQSESDKTWRLFLARMDRRKMNITTEKTDEGIAIQFNPEIDPSLKKYREKSVAASTEFMKYTSLKLWADYKFNKDVKYKQYEKYEDEPKLALKEVREILETLSKVERPNSLTLQHSEEETFFLFNHSIPAYVCSVLVKNNFDDLSVEDKSFCKNIILEVAASSLNTNYQYQISDGVQQAISVLPALLEVFPDEKEHIKIILLLSLFKDSHVGGMLSSKSFSIFPIIAIQKLWKNNFNDAHSLLLGYLLLRPKYDELGRIIREENYKKKVYESYDDQLLKRFIEDNDEVLQLVIDNKLTLSNLKDIEEHDLSILRTAFQMIPQKTDNNDHKAIAKAVISSFAKKLVLDDREDKIDYQVKHDFLQNYTYFVLNSPKDDIQDYLKPFVDNFNTSESIADLLHEFVLAEDALNTYDNFWLVWNTFKRKIFDICKEGDERWYVAKIVKSYLFATVPWKESAKEWNSLKDNNKRFFKEVSENIGHCPSAIYAVSKLLNDIGSQYIDDGVLWLSSILRNNRDLADKKLETNTIYYLENLTRKYIFRNREKIKRTKATKDSLLLILDYLIENGSVVGYMLRESIV